VASLVPDWLIGVWKNDLPGLSGKMKIMPLPAWEPGGARTSVMGGTMLGIPKATEDIEAAWSFARELYLSPDLAEGLFRQLNIISPVVDYWDEPYYDEPDPYFGGQVVGRLYIEQAPNVPVRPSLPFNSMALAEVANAMFLASEEVEARGYTEPSQIQPFLQAELDRGQARVERQLERNAFYELPEEDAP